jgi:dCMP deaminase
MDHCVHELPFMPNAGQEISYTSLSPLGAWPMALGKMRENSCRMAIHAEANALAYSARNGVAVEGADLFVTLSPCFSCAQIIIAAGLVRVVYDREYRDKAGIDLLTMAGIRVEKFSE